MTSSTALASEAVLAAESALNSGDTSWLLTASAMVLLMTPGLALFYGGMVRSKSTLNMIMMSFAAMGVVTITWWLVGYSLAFTGTNPVIGTLQQVGLMDLLTLPDDAAYPPMAFAAFQLTFAIITTALVSGAIADRAKFGGWVAFAALWSVVVYAPVARWAFYFGPTAEPGDGGWIADHLGALDFAGGTVVEVNSGAAALALALVLGPRVGWPRDRMRPSNLPLVLLGAGLLWFGWLGFNAGSAVAANNTAAVAFMNTQLAMAAAALSWITVEKLRDGNSTTLGIASGAVAGGVAITPSCAYVDPFGAFLIGIAAGAVCAFAVTVKYRWKYDDSLDVVGVHMVGGIVGMLMIGLLANQVVTGGVEGLLYGGGLAQLGKQVVAILAVFAYSFVMSALLGLLVQRTVGFRVTRDDEVEGVDTTVHAETAYDLVPSGGSGAYVSPFGQRPPLGQGSPFGQGGLSRRRVAEDDEAPAAGNASAAGDGVEEA